MANLVYVLVGVACSLIFADSYLTLHGLGTHDGKTIVEANRLMRWFVKSPWRLYGITILECVVVYFVARMFAVWVGWPFGAGVCAIVIVQRAIVVRKNYRLNVEVW